MALIAHSGSTRWEWLQPERTWSIRATAHGAVGWQVGENLLCKPKRTWNWLPECLSAWRTPAHHQSVFSSQRWWEHDFLYIDIENLTIAVSLCFTLHLRPGHVVLLQLPKAEGHGGIELGFLTSVWKGIKAPKIFAGETPVNSCLAFRAIAMNMVNQEIPWDLNGCVKLLNGSYMNLQCVTTSWMQMISMDSSTQEDASRWACSANSVAWVVRMESLVCILDCESCALD